MEVVTALAIGLGSKIAGYLAGGFVDVNTPWENFEKRLPEYNNIEAPSLLDKDTIARMSRRITSITPNMIPTGGAYGGLGAPGRQSIGDLDKRTTRSVHRALTSKATALIEELRKRDALRNIKDTDLRVRNMLKNAVQVQGFKKGMVDAAAAKAVVDTTEQELERKSVSDLVSTGGSLIGFLASAGGTGFVDEGVGSSMDMNLDASLNAFG